AEPAPTVHSQAYNPFRQGGGGNSAAPMQDWEALYRNFTEESRSALSDLEPDTAPGTLLPADEADPEAPADDVAAMSAATDMIPVGTRYVALADPRGLRLIDLRRAHFTVLHARFSRPDATFTSQRLIFPEQVTFGAADSPLVEELEPELALLGFDIAPLGQGVWSINAVPSAADGRNPAELLTELVGAVADGSAPNAADPLRDRLAVALARAASFRGDRRLSASETHHLLADLMALPLPGFTPTGDPTFTLITPTDIAKFL
ncbi:MAG: hypothetical protein K2M97_05310, partial [Muribaculaceae bacterium]|nr:hypothetical protein [Muribaculaceae bacterium]